MAPLIDVCAALPPRHVDPRLSRLYRRFGTSKIFSIADAADVLHISIDAAWRLLMMKGLEDSRFRVASNNGRPWLLAINPFGVAAKVWACQYHDVMRELPVPFGAENFAKATGIPYAAANTLLSILLQYEHLRQDGNPGDTSLIYRLPPRKVRLAA